MAEIRIGEATLDRVVEAEGEAFFPGFIFPDSTEEEVEREKGWMAPDMLDPASGRLRMSNHAFVLRRPGMVMLVDTCVGNGKERPSTKPWNMLSTDWLERLAGLGIGREDVTHVFNTHLHVDHCGWNTMRNKGSDDWVPTFPNARYLLPAREIAFWSDPANDTVTGAGSNDRCFEDSVRPVIEAGLVDEIGDGDAFEGIFRFEEAPGHSPGQLMMHWEEAGQRLLFTGDLFHSPLQLAHPDWSSRFDSDRAQAAETRRRFLERYGGEDLVLLPAHPMTPTAGRLAQVDGMWRYRLLSAAEIEALAAA